jgi:hypothetical protein
VVAIVEGEPIVVPEFLSAIAHERAGVAVDFSARLRASPGDQSWMARSGQQRATDVLRKKAIDYAITVKLEQIAMRTRGITQDVSYYGFLKQWEQENLRRRDALRFGLPIYGPQQYGRQEYYQYLLSNGLVALRRLFLNPTDSDAGLRQDYESLKDSMFRRGRRVSVQIARADYRPEARDDRKKHEVKTGMEAILRRLRAGQSLAAATRETVGVVTSETTYEQARQHEHVIGTSDAIAEVALQLGLNASSDVIDVGFAFTVVHCVAIDELGYVSFEEARASLQARRRERSFERYLQDLVDHADVRIVSEVYEHVVVD